jgi:sporulation protein YlmC with PRC-barrel domain
MTRTLMAAAAVGGLMLSVALAQSPAPNTSANPSASQSTPSSPPVQPAPSAQASPDAGAAGLSAKAITQQSPDQWLASKLKGTNVLGNNDEKIGDVSDVLFDKNGKVDAIIVGVGGFLGIGSKEVALPLSAFQVVPGFGGTADKLRLSTTKDELKQMAEFKPLSSSSTTTGSAPPSRPASPTSPAPTNR